jgi:hypothetical protein
VNAAWLNGVDGDLGTVEVAKIADLVVLRRNPLEDITAIRDIAAVLKGGRVVVDHLGCGDDHHDRHDHDLGRGVTALGVPLPADLPEPTPRLCC